MSNLTPQQQKHLDSIIQAFAEAATAKYTQGAKEHGGNLWEKSEEQLLNETMAETIDLFVYLATLKQKMRGEHE